MKRFFMNHNIICLDINLSLTNQLMKNDYSFFGRQKKNQKNLSAALLISSTNFFVHGFLQGFTAQKSERSRKKWNLKSTTLGRILKLKMKEFFDIMIFVCYSWRTP